MGAGQLASHVSTRVTPQSEPVPGKPQVPNSAGGYAFALDCWQRLDRFLVLGTEGGTYYIGERQLTKENAAAVLECAQQDPQRTVDRIVEISDAGRAPKNDPAIFALALLAGQPYQPISSVALAALPKVCRIGTHLFQFAEAVECFRGWGRSLKRAVADWYLSKDPKSLAFQVTKYQQRNGWGNKDLLRLSHPKTDDPVMNAIFAWVTDKGPNRELLPEPILAFEEAKVTPPEQIAALVRKHNMVRETIPTEALNRVDVWEALLQNMPITALIRNLGKMTSIGLVAPMSQASKLVVEKLHDEEMIRKGRVHPVTLLVALKTYSMGRGIKGSLSWNVVPQVVDALDDAFYMAFDAIEPTGKNWLLGLDVSGSMSCGMCGNTPLTPAEAAAAMAMATMRTEPNYYCFGFADGFRDLGLTAKMSLKDVLKRTDSLTFGGTDCAVPMLHAMQHKLDVDAFVVYTDNETWAGRVHPFQALQQYRQKMGKNAKLIVVGCTSNGFTIADPSDPGMLDVVGFDTTVPQVMSDFVR